MMTLRKTLLFLFAILTTSLVLGHELTSSQSETELIPRKVIFDNPEKISPKLSPDGSKVSYLAPDKNNVMNVWIKDGQDLQQVTSDQKRGIRSYVWQYDNEHIIYTQDKDGDENWHIYQTDINTHETKDLTPYPNIHAGVVAYCPQYPDQMLIQMNLRDPSLQDVYRVNLVTCQLELDTENPGNIIDWMADHRLCVRAGHSFLDNAGSLIQVRNGKGEPWRELLEVDPKDLTADMVGFSKDNQGLLILSAADGDTMGLVNVDIKTGKRSLYVRDPEYDLKDVIINPLTFEIEAIGIDKEKYEWKVIDSKLQDDFSFLSQELHTPYLIVNRDLLNKVWIVASTTDVDAVIYYLYHRQSKTLEYLFHLRPDLKKYELSNMTPVTFSARDGMKIHGYLTLPAKKDPRNLPTVLYVHGGPWTRDSWGFHPIAQWLANRGYAVLQINYRGSTGYGKHYLNAGNREWGAKMHTDLLDGKQWLIDSGITDPSRVAIMGGSYGGYATLVGLAFTPDEFCCGVDVVGPSNLITLLQNFPPYWKHMNALWNLRVGCVEKEPEFLKERSPLLKAHQINKPLLIAQGANDPRVRQVESDQIVNVMRQNNLYVEYLLFPDEGHGFVRPQNRLKFYAAAEQFLAKYLGGRCEAPSPEENWESLKK